MKEGWEIKELQDCLSYIKNGANIKQTKGASGIPITRIETLSGGQFHRDKLGYADVYKLGKFAPYVLDDADILMSHINSKAYIGRSVIYHKQGDEQIIHGMNLLRLKFFPDMINPEFANYYFKCTFFLSEVAKIRKDAVNQSSMAISDLKRIAIPVPPLSEQQHIVEELDLLSSIIEKKKAQIKELDNLAQSLFYEMFGDPITNEKGWDVKTWKDVFETKTGKLNANASTEGGKYPFFTCSKETSYIDTYAFDYEALLLAGNNASAIYDVKYYKGKFNAYQRTYILTIKEGVYPFYKISLEGKLSFLQSHSLGGLTKYLTMGVLNGLSFIAPPISLQQQFASKIEVIEHQKELIKQSIKEVETLFNSRMDYYFN